MTGKNHKTSEEIADRIYDPSDYEKNDPTSRGIAITHEQTSDTLTEGNYDAKIDKVDQDGNLISHQGEDISKQRNSNKKR